MYCENHTGCDEVMRVARHFVYKWVAVLVDGGLVPHTPVPESVGSKWGRHGGVGTCSGTGSHTPFFSLAYSPSSVATVSPVIRSDPPSQ